MYVSVTMTKQNLTVFLTLKLDVLMYFISYFIFDSKTRLSFPFILQLYVCTT